MKNYTATVLCAICALTGFFIGKEFRTEITHQTVAAADTITILDTIHVANPAPTFTRKRTYLTEKLAVAECEKLENDSVQQADSITVSIPIDTIVYDNSDFRAVISGFHAALDSLQIYKTEKITTRFLKPKRWAVSCGVGLTAGPGGVKPGVYVGVGYVLHSF